MRVKFRRRLGHPFQIWVRKVDVVQPKFQPAISKKKPIFSLFLVKLQKDVRKSTVPLETVQQGPNGVRFDPHIVEIDGLQNHLQVVLKIFGKFKFIQKLINTNP